jgi:hypothetical protein
VREDGGGEKFGPKCNRCIVTGCMFVVLSRLFEKECVVYWYSKRVKLASWEFLNRLFSLRKRREYILELRGIFFNSLIFL